METNGDSLFFTRHQVRVFVEDLPRSFQEAGFEIVEEPYIDYGLGGFRATYVRRYLLYQTNSLHDGILTTIIHTVGLPFGNNGHKMVILSAPRNLKNEPVSETLKLRIHFDDAGTPHVIQNLDQRKPHSSQQQQHQDTAPDRQRRSGEHGTAPFETSLDENSTGEGHLISIIQQKNRFRGNGFSTDNLVNLQFMRDLANYVSHIIEVISPGLIELPDDVKLEILKQLSLDSIIKMSQVNNEFRTLIFKYGESLWRHLCFRDFNIRFINRLVHKSWMELYRDTYVLHQIEICRKERALPGLPERLALPPVPYRLQIEWLPEVLELPYYPLQANLALPDNPMLALEFHPLRRVNSLDSLP